MAGQISPILKEHFAKEPTELLLQIWETNDIHHYSPAAFAAIAELLQERGVTPPPPLPPPPPTAIDPTPGAPLVQKGCLYMTLAVVLSVIVSVLYTVTSISPATENQIRFCLGLMSIWGLRNIVVGSITWFRHRSKT